MAADAPGRVGMTFSICVLVNYAADPAAMKRLLPAHLEPETHDGRGLISISGGDARFDLPCAQPELPMGET